MSKVKPRVRVPKKVKAGEVVTIKTIISHKMESGQRKDRKTGEIIPREIINKFTVTFNGTPVFDVDIDPAVSANPYFEFDVKVPEAGEFHFTWVDDNGSVYEKKSKVALA